MMLFNKATKPLKYLMFTFQLAGMFKAFGANVMIVLLLCCFILNPKINAQMHVSIIWYLIYHTWKSKTLDTIWLMIYWFISIHYIQNTRWHNLRSMNELMQKHNFLRILSISVLVLNFELITFSNTMTSIDWVWILSELFTPCVIKTSIHKIIFQ